jgi:hypothetical protein
VSIVTELAQHYRVAEETERAPTLADMGCWPGPQGWSDCGPGVSWGYSSGTRVGVARVRVSFLKNAGAVTRM